MDNRKLLFGAAAAIAAIAIGLAVYATISEISGGDNSPDHAGGLHYLCSGCGKSFGLTTKELANHHKDHYGEPVPCPYCKGTQTSQASLCSKCKKPYLPDRTSGSTVCPNCRK